METASLLQTIDESKGSSINQMEVLLFSSGSREIFGINVFKVREVCHTPKITRIPFTPNTVDGVISLRGNIIPVIHLASFLNGGSTTEDAREAMIVAEFSRHTIGLLVEKVDHIIRIGWDRVRPPEGIVGESALVTGIIELDDGRLVSLVDVEQILADVIGIPQAEAIARIEDASRTVFFCDDSQVARREIVSVLDHLGVKYQFAPNGAEAWRKLRAMAQAGALQNLALVLTDAEMPEMDGFTLTQNIKSDSRFAAVPVVMHSSLSNTANRTMGQKVGVDAYVTKFDAEGLADTLRPFLIGA